GFGRREAQSLRAVRDAFGDDIVLDVVAALKGERWRQAADTDRLLFVIDAERYGRNDDQGDAAVFRLVGPDEPDSLDQLEDHALALAGRQRDDEASACGGRERGPHGRALPATAIGVATDRSEQGIAFAASVVELAAGGLGRGKSFDAVASIFEPC